MTNPTDPPNHFDEDVAATYDADAAGMSAPEVIRPTVDLLAWLAGDGAALELAVGTGRVAVPLAARGVPVHGIELSEAMVARLRANDPEGTVGVTVGDMTTTRVPGAFRVAYLVFNTVANVTTQEGQVACFRNAAAHLEPGGCFVVENGVPQLQRLPLGERYVPFEVTPEHLGFDEYDVVTQQMWSHHYRPREGRHVSVPFRYAWPAELDLMARLAGLRLRDRWAGFDRAPFIATSPSHVSVWEKPER
jgi:hypothetical protein